MYRHATFRVSRSPVIEGQPAPLRFCLLVSFPDPPQGPTDRSHTPTRFNLSASTREGRGAPAPLWLHSCSRQWASGRRCLGTTVPRPPLWARYPLPDTLSPLAPTAVGAWSAVAASCRCAGVAGRLRAGGIVVSRACQRCATLAMGGGGVSSTGCDIKEKKKLILFSYAAGCLHLAHTTRLWQPRRTRRHPPSLAPDALAPPSPTAAHSSRPPRIPRRTRVRRRAGGREASPPRWPRVGRASAAASVHTSAALIPS